jgi:pimeloyl-ACP methyl ester carboxylesterase
MPHAVSPDGTPIAYEAAGTGRPIVLVGGAFQTRDDPLMTGLASALAERFTVVRYDRRGRGGSGDAIPYRDGCEEADLSAVINTIGGQSAVFGMSSGAVLALEAAAHGAPISALVVYEPPVIVGGRDPVPANDPDELRALIAEGDRDGAVRRFMTGAVGLREDLVAGMRQAPFWSAMTALAHTLPYDGSIMRPYQRGRALEVPHWQTIEAPVLVIDGEASPPWIRTGAAAVADAVPGAARRTLDGQGHDVEPDVLAEAVALFVARDRPSRSGSGG